MNVTRTTATATAGTVMIAIVVAAMLGGVRRIAYGALAALVLAGLWPLLILLGGFAALMILAVVFGLVAGEGIGDVGLGDVNEGVVRGGAKLASIYYRFLGRVRHPVVWGVVAGAIAGTAAVWGSSRSTSYRGSAELWRRSFRRRRRWRTATVEPVRIHPERTTEPCRRRCSEIPTDKGWR